jgi:hypothetical protein
LIADIAAGSFDPFAGRLLRGVDDSELLEQEMQDIEARDARALRFSGVGDGPKGVSQRIQLGPK